MTRLFDIAITDLQLARNLVLAQTYHRDSLPEFSLDRWAATLTNQSRYDAYYPVKTAFPAVFITQFEDSTNLLIDGANGTGLLAFTALGYQDISAQTGSGPYNTFVKEIGDSIYDTIQRPPFRPLGDVFISGYSLGGAVAFYLADRLMRLPGKQIVKVISFNNTKPAGFGLQSMFFPSTAIRYFCNDDPMTHLAPGADDHWANTMVLFGSLGRYWADFRQPGPGIEVDVAGNMRTAYVASQSGNPIAPSLVGLALQYASGPDRSHSIQTIARRLLLAIPAVPSGQTEFRGGTMGLPDFKLTPLQVKQGERSATNAYYATGATQTANPVFVPDGSQFQAKRSGRIWSVHFRDTLVVVAPSKKKARGIARDGNDLLRRLQPASVVDTGAFIEAFANYLSDASDPNAGFEPVMRTIGNPR